MHSRRTVTATRPLAARGHHGYADTSVAWAAKLVQPRSDDDVLPGLPRLIVVDVAGPAVLGGRVEVAVASARDQRPPTRWVDARWEGDPGQHRRCIAVENMPALIGAYRVYVRPFDGEAPTLTAGLFPVRVR